MGQRVGKARDVFFPGAEWADVGAWFRWASTAWVFILPLSIYWPIAPSMAPGLPHRYVRPGLYFADLVAGALILTGLILARGSHWQWGLRRITVSLLGIVALGLLTASTARSPTLAGYTATRWVLAGLVYLVLLQSGPHFEWWITVFVAGLGLNALIGLTQVVGQSPLGLPAELAMDPSQSGASIIAIGDRRWLRAYGMTVHPNVLGGFLAMGLLLSLPLLRRWRIRSMWWLLGLGLLLSFSRSAWLAVAVVLPPLTVWLAWRQPELRRPLATTAGGAVLIVLVAGGLLAGQLSSRLHPAATPTEARSLNERAELIAVALEIIADSPFTGVGAGNFPLAMLDGDRAALPQPVHNVPLLLAAEVGIAGGFLWILLWLTPGLALERQWPSVQMWAVTLAGAWFAWGIIGLWDSYPWALNVGPFFGATLLAFCSLALEAR